MGDRVLDLRAALDAEERWQRDALAAGRRLAWADQVATGIAWPEIAVEDALPARRGRWTWCVRSRTDLPDAPGVGDAVEIMPAGAVAAKWRGWVKEVVDSAAEIEVEHGEEPPARARVALRHDTRTFERLRGALSRVATRNTPLAAILRGERPWTPSEPSELVLDGGLDATQGRALALALGAPALGVLYGPPGTGKTRTVVAGLRALVACGERPWALADSNAAADHLVVQAAAGGLRVVRVGPPARVTSRAAAWTLETAIRAHSVAAAVTVIDRDLRRLAAQRGRGAERRSLFEERDRLVEMARTEILGAAEVIVTTLGTLAREAPRLPPARTAVIDEATQASEPATWVAAAWVERLVLAGDPHQLGPVVLQPGNPLQESLLQRLLREAPEAVRAGMLEQQRRMHPTIQALVQDVYGDRYRAHEDVLSRDEPGDGAMWIDTSGAALDEQRDPVTGSWRSPGEAAVVVTVVRQWLESGVRPEDIGVITPYSAQVSLLRGRPGLEGVEVATVNGFQGREKEAIVFSLVRSNDRGETGFAVDRRRFTVAITRARRALVVVGDLSTVGRVAWVQAAADRLGESGAVRTVWEEPWVEALSA